MGHPHRAQRISAEYDIILIAAANFLFPGFDFGGMAEFIERTDLPVAIVELGAQSKDYSPHIPLKPGTERLMRVVAERAPIIGVRGPFTAQVLDEMNIRNVQIVGCPSYYMNGEGDALVCDPTLSEKPKDRRQCVARCLSTCFRPPENARDRRRPDPGSDPLRRYFRGADRARRDDRRVRNQRQRDQRGAGQAGPPVYRFYRRRRIP